MRTSQMPRGGLISNMDDALYLHVNKKNNNDDEEEEDTAKLKPYQSLLYPTIELNELLFSHQLPSLTFEE